jgi:copper chaperone CopZ
MLKKLTFAFCLMVLAADSIWAGTRRVSVVIEGMACPFCTYNVEKRIKTLDGAAKDLNWAASVEAGTVGFDWQGDVTFSKKAVREQIIKAGFTPGKIKIDAPCSATGATSDPPSDQPEAPAKNKAVPPKDTGS